MATNESSVDTQKTLAVLSNEDEFIFKPFQSGYANEIGAVECGKVVSRLNKVLFDYQIGDKANSSLFSSLFSRKITLTIPESKKFVLEFYQNCLPFCCGTCVKQEVHCWKTLSDEMQSIGTIRQGMAFGKVWYDIYNDGREQVVSLVLHKNRLRSKIQSVIPEYAIMSNDEVTNIGRIHPYSTDLEGTDYGKAVAVNITQDMTVENKAMLLVATLIAKAQLV